MPDEARRAGTAIAWCPSSTEGAVGRGWGLQPLHQSPGLLCTGLAVPREDHGWEEEAIASPALRDPGLEAQSQAPARSSRTGSEEEWWRVGPIGHMDGCPEWAFSGRNADEQSLKISGEMLLHRWLIARDDCRYVPHIHAHHFRGEELQEETPQRVTPSSPGATQRWTGTDL